MRSVHRLLAERRGGKISRRSVAIVLASSAKKYICERLKEEEIFAKVTALLTKTLANPTIASLSYDENGNSDDANYIGLFSHVLRDSQILRDLIRAALNNTSSIDPDTVYKTSRRLFRNMRDKSFILDHLAKAFGEYIESQSVAETDHQEE